jgi:hypothetical protein
MTLQKIRRALLVASAFVGVISMALYGILENTYVNYARTPEQALGRNSAARGEGHHGLHYPGSERTNSLDHMHFDHIWRSDFDRPVSEPQVAAAVEQVKQGHRGCV